MRREDPAESTTVECPHGVKVTTSLAVSHLDGDGPLARLWWRNMLLACPRCRFDADGYMPEPGA